MRNTAKETITDRERIENFLRFGNYGDEVWYDENQHKVMRADKGLGDGAGLETLPECKMYDHGKYIGTTTIWKALDFLFEGIEDMDVERTYDEVESKREEEWK